MAASSRSSLLAFQPSEPSVRSVADPAGEVRRILEAAIAPDELPPTRDFRLYYIRGVGNSKYTGGEDKDVVLYTPEFLYVLDVGFPAFPAVQLPYEVSGHGDPHFPNFSRAELRSVPGEDWNNLIFPDIPGRLLVGVRAGTDEETVRRGLAPYVHSVEPLVPDLDLYLAEVRLFHEQQVGDEIERNVAFVRYAQPDGVVRLIDFLPGWFVDRVC